MRARYEAQIKHLDTWSGNEFDRALSRVILGYRNPLEFFTDEQLGEIRAEMIKREWFRHKLNRENRLAAAAPELLEALAWFVNDIDGSHTNMADFDANVTRARAAIARAEGRDQ